MSFLFDVASVLMIATGCGYLLLAGVAYFSYTHSGSKFLLMFLGAFITLFFMNLYGGLAGAYHPFDGSLLGYLFGGFTFYVLSTDVTVSLLADITVENMFVFEAMGVIAVIFFIIALYKA